MPDPADNILGKVHHGDCIAGMRDVPEESVDLVFADPPFNIGYEYDTYEDQLESDQYLQWSRDWMTEVHRLLKPDGAFWLAIGDEYAAELKVAATSLGFTMRSWVVWYYTFGVHCRTKFTRSHAHLFHFVKDEKQFTFNADEVSVPSARQLVYADKRANPKGRMPDDTWILRPQDLTDGFTPEEDVWYFPRVAGTFKERAGFHGCQMPEQLLGRIVRSSSNPDDVVMDPFGGSGTTLVVAKKLGRRFFGFEMSPEYVQLGQERIDAVFAGDLLNGSPEPKASVPATYSPQARQKQPTPVDQREFENLRFDFDAVMASDEAIEIAITHAYHATHRGYSVERLVADPVLNEDFQDQCDRLEVSLSQRDRNRFLFALRKQGSLNQNGPTLERVTKFPPATLDALADAAEIAWNHVRQLYGDCSLDDLLCDPRLANQLDTIAMRWCPDATAFETRWAAIELREQRVQAAKRAMELDSDRREQTRLSANEAQPIETLDREMLPKKPGVYGLWSGDDAVYFGETRDLSSRLKRFLGAAPPSPWSLLGIHDDSLHLAWLTVDSVLEFPQVNLFHMLQESESRLNLPRPVLDPGFQPATA
ncbi:MAG: site-specific DNA-methyltransferase [Planctomycetota bacterium]